MSTGNSSSERHPERPQDEAPSTSEDQKSKFTYTPAAADKPPPTTSPGTVSTPPEVPAQASTSANRERSFFSQQQVQFWTVIAGIAALVSLPFTVMGALDKLPNESGKGKQDTRVSPSIPAERQVRAEKDTWIDLDPEDPAIRGTDEDPPPTDIDLKVGPDNLYPENSARIWQTTSPETCATQAESNGDKGFQDQIQLDDVLRSESGQVVYVCLVTTEKDVARLQVSSVNNDTNAPYLIRYKF